MKIFFLTLTIFFGTLMAAGLVALGEPVGPGFFFLNPTGAQSQSADASQIRRYARYARLKGEWTTTATGSGLR